MSSQLSEKKHQNITLSEITEEKIIILKKAFISFSQLSGIPHTEFIYTGDEKIPFSDMHPVYQTIFQHEFADALKKSFKEKKRL